MIRFILRPTALFFTIFFIQSSFAITTTWTGLADTAWNVAGNWDNGVPATGDLAQLGGVVNPLPVNPSPIISVVGEVRFLNDIFIPYILTNDPGGRFDLDGNGFVNNAADTQIVNNNGAMRFLGTSDAGSNITITNTNALLFLGTSTATNAVIVNNAGGSGLSIDGLTAAGISIGSLSGNGAVSVTGKTLTVGGLNTSTTVSGVISGNNGALTKTGTGTLTLTAINTFNGVTTINNGTLELGNLANPNASLAGPVTINANGTLKGVGTVNSNVANNGNIAPGGSIGTLTITGAYTQAAGATYTVEIDNAGNSDLLAVTGIATLDGTLAVDSSAGFVANQPYTIITSTAGVNGTFATINQGALTITPSYSANQVNITVVENAALLAAAAASSANTVSFANYLLSIPSNQLPLVISNLLSSPGTTEAILSIALTQMAATSISNEGLDLSRIAFASGFEDELADRYSLFPVCKSNGPRVEKSHNKIKVVDCNQQRSIWLIAEGAEDELSAVGGNGGLNTSHGGGAIGFESPIRKSGAIGVAMSFGRFDNDATGVEISKATGNLYQLGLYGRYKAHNFLFGGAVDGGITDTINGKRTVAFANANVPANYDAYLFSEQFRVSYIFHNFLVRPFIGVFNQNVTRNKFTEKGNTGVELTINQSTYHSFRTQLGIMLDIPTGETTRPFASIAWEREFAQDFSEYDAQLAQVGGNAFFHVKSTPIGENIYAVKAGIQITKYRNMDISIMYTGLFTRHWGENGGRFQLNYRFV